MSKKTRGADLLVNALAAAGTKRLFALSGNQIMPVFDACIDSDIELVHVRHEAAAVHMADAWGRLTGEPGVALVTAGSGIANTLSALYVALMAESPCILLSGHAPGNLLGRGAFQEMAQADMAGHVTKASWTATKASGLGRDVTRAFRLARSGRPGPVHLSLPFDLLESARRNAGSTSTAGRGLQADCDGDRSRRGRTSPGRPRRRPEAPSAGRPGDDARGSASGPFRVGGCHPCAGSLHRESPRSKRSQPGRLRRGALRGRPCPVAGQGSSTSLSGLETLRPSVPAAGSFK